MKKQKLTCEKARDFSIEKFLEKSGHFPKKRSEKEAWFLSPLRSETQASFKVSLVLNRFYDHGLGKGGDIILLVQLLNNCSVSEALEILSQNLNLFSFQQQSQNLIQKEIAKTYTINTIKKLEHFALLEYLKSRNISNEIAKNNCVEIHYTINSKKYFSIGFKNDLIGYEIRNKYIKGSLGKKGFTHVINHSKTINVFEGFIDYLSYLEIKSNVEIEDFMILNSISNAEKSLRLIEGYENINLFLDNDEAGKKTVTFYRNKTEVNDCSRLYKKHNDLNDFLCRKDWVTK